MSNGPHKRTDHLVCKRCNTEIPVSKEEKIMGIICPECGMHLPKPLNPLQPHIKIID